MAKVLVLFFIPLFARAEYRAYRLQISNQGQSREVITNFDHLQYPQVYPLESGESVAYLNSWMCWGRMGSTPPCQDPKTSLPEPTSGTESREPASQP